ncbi:hypothetical protein YC2023_058942 [Brassica napus]
MLTCFLKKKQLCLSLATSSLSSLELPLLDIKECQSIVATELDQYQKGVSCMQREVVVKLGCHRESSVNMENLQRLLKFQQSDQMTRF